MTLTNEPIGEGYYSLYDYAHAQQYLAPLAKNVSPAYLLKNMEDEKTAIKKNMPDTGSDKPNVCWVVLDCIRAKSMSCYGYEHDTTPFLRLLFDISTPDNFGK